MARLPRYVLPGHPQHVIVRGNNRDPKRIRVGAEIKAGALHLVLENFRLQAFGIHAVFPSSSQIPAKVRLFVDFMQDELSSVSFFLGVRSPINAAQHYFNLETSVDRLL